MSLDEDYDIDQDCPVSYIKVPTLPERKQPCNVPSFLSINSRPSQIASSTQDCSTSKSVSQDLNIFDSSNHGNPQDKQILSMIQSFHNASGITRRELECKIIKNLTNQTKQIDKQDKFVISMAWVKQYTSYLYENEKFRPQQINNYSLFEDANCTIFRKNLQHNRDYVTVNDIVWMFLKEEYQGGPEIVYENYQHQTRRGNRPINLEIPSRTSIQRPSSVDPNIGNQLNVKHQQVNYEIPIVGFKNELFFCYMNSGLQSLLSLPDMNYFFLRYVKQIYREQLPRRQMLQILPYTMAYLDMIESVRYNETKEYIKLGTLKTMLAKKFNPRQQHDCLEFLLYLLSSMEEELSVLQKEVKRSNIQAKQLDVNFIQHLFKGQIESKVICNNKSCQPSTITESFITISLALKAKTLEGCLDDFFKEERIKDYKCDHCSQVGTLKKTYISSQPKHIIFHLKRFKFFPKQLKISTALQFPLDNLSLKKYKLIKTQQPEITYKLRAIVVHQGSLDSGHYYCFGRRFHQVLINAYIQWFLFNDQSAKRISKKDLLSQQAYLLIYSMQTE